MKAKDTLLSWLPRICREEKLSLRSLGKGWVHWLHFKQCLLWGTIEAIFTRVCSGLRGTARSTPSSYPNHNRKLTRWSICHRVNNAAWSPTSTTSSTGSFADKLLQISWLLLAANWVLLAPDCCFMRMWHITCTSHCRLPHTPVPSHLEKRVMFFGFQPDHPAQPSYGQAPGDATAGQLRSLDLGLRHWPAIVHQSGDHGGDLKPKQCSSWDGAGASTPGTASDLLPSAGVFGSLSDVSTMMVRKRIGDT